MCFSLDKFKNTASIETTTSGWFSHEDARRKREVIARLIRQTSDVARAVGLVERGPPLRTPRCNRRLSWSRGFSLLSRLSLRLRLQGKEN